MKKPKTLLQGVTFDFEKDDKSPLGPHLAYTLAEQGGAASGYNRALIFKAKDTNITEELLKALSDAGITLEEVEIKEEESNNQLLQAIKAKYK
ncbi:hypothetical protein [Yersinia vastinensis]|uniref:hypothetical protein n=1 Tax=Yersinia vastinensis TaxID=2890318 RepID=UPI0005DDD135|nr:hypothetical protein [Yersinia vastinensis]CNJ03650.1 Uncharacterised protein [Yersinia frederiksenii]